MKKSSGTLFAGIVVLLLLWITGCNNEQQSNNSKNYILGQTTTKDARWHDATHIYASTDKNDTIYVLINDGDSDILEIYSVKNPTKPKYENYYKITELEEEYKADFIARYGERDYAMLTGTHDIESNQTRYVLFRGWKTEYTEYFSGLEIYDIADPDHPTKHASLTLNGGPTKMVLSPDKKTAYVTVHELDQEMYEEANATLFNGVRIVDISDPSSPSIIASFSTGSNGGDKRIGLTLSHDGNTLYIAAKTLYVVDVSSPKNPRLSTTYNTSPVADIERSRDGQYFYGVGKNFYVLDASKL